jgi:N-acetyl sugar amidotransferase
MDTTDPRIEFDENGFCNHCRNYNSITNTIIFKSNTERDAKRDELIEKIKQDGKGKKYDAILPLSGGVDSTYAAYLAKEKMGINPLVLHVDNGWNSELAVNNIEHTLKKLGLDLITYVLDWDEFRDIQLAYLRASVVDIEVVTDHATKALFFKVANKYGLKYILTGKNHSSEGILPQSWLTDKNDLRNLVSIHKKFGKIKMKSYPKLGLCRYNYYTWVKRINFIALLDYFPYVKSEAEMFIIKNLEWRNYGGKHHESIFTKFFQTYILPGKFNVDKRKAHLSSLICCGQTTRKEALQELKKPLTSKEEIENDKAYVAKKLDISVKELESILKLPPKNFTDYPSYHNSFYYPILRSIYRLAKKIRSSES